MTDDPRLAFLRELERTDEAVATVLAELDALAEETEAVRSRAVDLEALLLKAPAEREILVRADEDAQRELQGAHEALAQAEAQLAAAEKIGAESLPAARRLAVRACDRLGTAERRAAEAVQELALLEGRVEEAGRESAQLEERARTLARSLRGRPRLAKEAGADPGPGLAGVAEWGSRARAALFVARGALESERDALVRQANELGSLVLGEALISTSASLVTRQVERALEHPS